MIGYEVLQCMNSTKATQHKSQSQVQFKTKGSDFVSLLATKKIEICLRFSLLVAPFEIITL